MIGLVVSTWLDVRSRPWRTLAAISGMVATVLAIVLVDAAATLSREANATYLARLYGRAVTVSIVNESGLATADDDARLERILRSNGVRALSTDFNVPAHVSYSGVQVFHALRLVSPEFADIHIVDIVAGAWPVDTARSSVFHVVVNEGWAEQNLGLSDEQAVGQVLGYSAGLSAPFDGRVTPVQPLVINGVVSTESLAFASGSSPVAVVTANPIIELLPQGHSTAWVARVHPHDYQFVQELVASITDPLGQPLYRVGRADQGDQLAPVLEQQEVTGRAVTTFALLIGGLGILAVGIAGVRERAKEYGLRRALGASRPRIFGSVIAQTVMESLLAALIAIPLAALLTVLFAREMVLPSLPLPPSTALPVRSALLGLAAAVLVGLIAGLLPAIHATRVSVVQALRG